ncbi:MAG: AraC family transcriptional regulator [Chthoniobacter sp.]
MSPIAPEAPERLDHLLRFLHSQLAADLSNAVLARRAAMGESAFIRWFKEHTGATPAIYVQQARAHHAAQLLALTDRTIEQIAADCGFPNRYYFTRVFRRHLGAGPAEYRKRQVRAGVRGTSRYILPSLLIRQKLTPSLHGRRRVRCQSEI